MHNGNTYVTFVRVSRCIWRADSLPFCFSLAHAKSMAGCFTQAVRTDAVKKLRDGDLKVICSCASVSEGIDVPEANAVFLLLSTQSTMIFNSNWSRACTGSCQRHLLIFDFPAITGFAASRDPQRKYRKIRLAGQTYRRDRLE